MKKFSPSWRPALVCVFVLSVLACSPKNKNEVYISSYKELGAFFQTYGFTFDTWRAGFRAVPRAFVTQVPQRWAKIADKVPVEKKKEIFYSAMLPIVLQANETIMADRRRAEPIAMHILARARVSEADRQFIKELASRYQIDLSSDVYKDRARIKELLLRVDIVPPSLALAQAAYESAYATSRFAALGNALFGQQADDGEGMKPLGEHPVMGHRHIAAFESPLESTLAYMFNLNTHKAYAKFRKRRSEFRRNGKFPDGAELALTLTAYSERGAPYAREIAHVIRDLHLTQADLAFLREMEPIYLVPRRFKFS